MSPAEISREPLWHPWADFLLKAKTKWPPDISRSNIMIYQQMKPGTSKFRPTSFSCDFDLEIHFLHYFYDIRLFSRSKSQFQGQISKIPFLTIKARNICVIPLFFMGFCLKNPFMLHVCIILVILGHLQGRKYVNSKIKKKMAARYFKVKYDCSNRAIHFLYYFHDSRSSSRVKKSISRSTKQDYYFY